MLLAYFIYIALLVLSFVFAGYNNRLLFSKYYDLEEDKKYYIWKWPLVFIFLILVLVVGLRYDVGVDYIGYKWDYDGLFNGYGQAHRYEFGYKALIYILKFLGFESWAIFTVVAFIIWYYFIKSFNVFPFLLKWGFLFAITTGFLFASMNGIRQAVALVVFMYAVRYIRERSLLKYTLYMILALSFHSSALLVYPFYFFVHKPSLTGKKWIIVYIVTFVIGDRINIKDIIVYGINNILPMYAHYAERFLRDFEEPLTAGLGSFYFFLVGLLVISLSGSFLQKIPRLKIYYNLYYIGAIIYNFLWKYAILGRVYFLFIWFEIFCLAAIVYYMGKSKYSPLLYLLIISQIVFFVYKIFKGENQCAPFQFI